MNDQRQNHSDPGPRWARPTQSLQRERERGCLSGFPRPFSRPQAFCGTHPPQAMGLLAELSRANGLLGSKSGRDKLYKTLQYLLKLMLELAHMRSIENQWLPLIKRISLRLSQSRALFRYGRKPLLFRWPRALNPSWSNSERHRVIRDLSTLSIDRKD